MTGCVLVVDDEPEMRSILQQGLSFHEFEVSAVPSAEEGLAMLRVKEFDVILADIHLNGMDGIELCRHGSEVQPGIAIIVMTAFGDFDAAVAAMRAGARDFLSKPVDVDVAAMRIFHQIERRKLTREVQKLRVKLEALSGFGELIGTSAVMTRVYDKLAMAARSEATVLLTGESGTGKELVARALHRQGKNQEGRFVAVNCAAIPEALFESELFGHVQGAFTDARRARTGLFLRANRGTLFLDEIGEMPLSMQVKLLRALEERVVRPVGDHREIPFQTRVISATNRDIESMVGEGQFRQDLFYRLHVIRIELPPLRARGADILLLAQHFAERHAANSKKEIRGITSDAADTLTAYDWPGNVRELSNCMEHAVALARGEQITVADLSDSVRNHAASWSDGYGADGTYQPLSLDEVERRHVLGVLRHTNGSLTRAAKILGRDRKTIQRKLQRWGIPRDRESS